VNILDILR